jgi:hypothetical protein
MPYEFVYKIDNTDHVFRCDIPGGQCEAQKKNGRGQCGRVSVIGTPYCYSHLLSEKKLRIKPSLNRAAGKGLFAQTKGDPNAVVFKNNATIIDYTGDTIDLATLNARYNVEGTNRLTAPYAFEIKKDESYVDSACKRGVASLVNHKPISKANAKFVKTKDDNGVFNGVKLVAKKNIRNNKEIYASYGTTYRMRRRSTHKTTYKRNPRR